MTAFVALVRAVNVGGTGKLPMDELRSLCARLGFGRVQTYIASGNVIFEAEGGEAEVQARLAGALGERTGKPVGVLIRTPAQLETTLAANPYGHRAGNLVHVVFLDAPPAPDLPDRVRGRGAEEIAARGREIYIHYPQGQGASKLRLPADAAAGTARNVNTVAKLAELSRG